MKFCRTNSGQVRFDGVSWGLAGRGAVRRDEARKSAHL
jgi:hypothetical protein